MLETTIATRAGAAMLARWWLRSPLTIFVFVVLVVLVPFLLAMPYAMFGHTPDPFSGLSGLGGPIGILISARIREPEYWRLDRRARRRVREVQITRQPSGDRDIDGIVVGRLSKRAEHERANAVTLPIALVVIIATPVIAALRTGHDWWLIASLPGALCLALWLFRRRRDSPRARLDRLVERIGRASSGR